MASAVAASAVSVAATAEAALVVEGDAGEARVASVGKASDSVFFCDVDSKGKAAGEGAGVGTGDAVAEADAAGAEEPAGLPGGLGGLETGGRRRG